MSETVYQYRIWCTDAPAHYEYVWGTTTPTVCPSDGSPIDTSLTTIVQTINSDDVSVTNLQRGAFGELMVSDLNPLVQLGFTYNNSEQLTETTVTGSGTVTNADHMAVVSTGAAINSSAKLNSLKPIKYRPGQGVSIRFTALFTAGVGGNTQEVGAFNGSDGIGFGFNGTDFGLFRKSDGVYTWIAQTVWNTDKLDGTGPSGLNINFGDGKGNVFEIKFQYLGFGGLIFCVENPGTAKYVTVHVIAYANSATVPSFHIASFPVAMKVENTTNNTDIIVKSGSMMGGVEGPVVYTGPQFNNSWLNITVSNGTETFIAGWQVRTTFQSHSNKTLVYATQITTATGATDRPQILRLRKNATFTSPVWTDINTTQSVVQTLTGGTWNSDGSIIHLQVVPGQSNPFILNITISPNSLFGAPGDNMILTLEGINGIGSSTGSLSWLEDQ